jgi:hypothetical protein
MKEKYILEYVISVGEGYNWWHALDTKHLDRPISDSENVVRPVAE